MRVQIGLMILITLLAGCNSAVTLTPDASSTPSPTPVIEAQLDDLPGRWVGGFKFEDEWTYVTLEIESEGDGFQATFNFPAESHLNRIRVPLAAGEGAALSVGFQLDFRLPDYPQPLVFDGQFDGRALAGSVMTQDRQGTFELLRRAELTIEQIKQIEGNYEIEPGRFVTIAAEAGAISYFDYTDGRFGELLARSETTFGAGLSNAVLYPIESTFTFTKDGSGEVTGLVWTQTEGEVSAVKVHRYREEDVTFQHADVTLAGTVFTPLGEGPHPAMVFLHGSEPARRRNRFYRALAQYFALHGVATLISDKRGVGDSSGTYVELAAESNLSNLAGDQLAAVELLRGRAEINRDQIGFWGASQAGWVAPLAAAQSDAVAFVLLISGPTVTPDQERVFERLIRQSDAGSSQQVEEDITQQVLASTRSGFDPIPYLEQMTIPGLWIYGGHDTSIPVQASIQLLEQIRDAGDKDFTIQLFPTGNHGIVDSMTGYEDEFPLLRGFAPGYFDTMRDWLLAHVDVAQ